MRRFMAGAFLALAASTMSALAAPPEATASPNPAMLVMAKEWFHRIQSGDIDRSQLTDQMNAALSNAMVKQVAAQVGPMGEPVAFVQIRSGERNGSEFYLYQLTFASGSKWNYLFVYEPSTQKISGLRITPAP